MEVCMDISTVLMIVIFIITINWCYCHFNARDEDLNAMQYSELKRLHMAQSENNKKLVYENTMLKKFARHYYQMSLDNDNDITFEESFELFKKFNNL